MQKQPAHNDPRKQHVLSGLHAWTNWGSREDVPINWRQSSRTGAL